MGSLSGQNRPHQPLQVILMAVALVLAAFGGAMLGFLLDFATGADDSQASSTAQNTDPD